MPSPLLRKFTPSQIHIVKDAVSFAEELVSNAYKMSASQWLRRRYDIQTLKDLSDREVVDGPFAQVIRYEGQLTDSSLGSTAYDFYKICFQDHAILAVLDSSAALRLFPFILYITVHELIHVVRFSQFLQCYEASEAEIAKEEKRVHFETRQILSPLRTSGLDEVFNFYQKWDPSAGRKDSYKTHYD